MVDFSPLWTLLKLLLCLVIILSIYAIYSIFFIDKYTIECTEKPTITYEFKGQGKKIDTVWIYKFKR